MGGIDRQEVSLHGGTDRERVNHVENRDSKWVDIVVPERKGSTFRDGIAFN